MEIFQIVDLPNGFDQLVDEASSDGHRFLEKMRQEWVNGTNRFSQTNEILFGINMNHRLIAIGGLNIDPYVTDPSIGRVRHVYVLKKYRGSGLGQKLVNQIFAHAKNRFRILRLRTHNPSAARFYDKMGFKVENVPEDPSHVYMNKML